MAVVSRDYNAFKAKLLEFLPEGWWWRLYGDRLRMAWDYAIPPPQPEARGVDVEAIRRACQSGKRFWQAGPGYYEEIESLLPATPDPVRAEQPVVDDGFEAWLDRDWPLWRNNEGHPILSRLRRCWTAALSGVSAPVGVGSDKRDARRYRYLRSHYDVSASRRGFYDLLAIRPPQKELPSTGPTMDAFVDAALAGKDGAK